MMPLSCHPNFRAVLLQRRKPNVVMSVYRLSAMRKSVLVLCLTVSLMSAAQVQVSEKPWMPRLTGTIRTKFELQTEEMESRFEVRNARVAFVGDVVKGVSYKAEIDFSDEGAIKMRDAYGEVKPFDFRPERQYVGRLALRLGQFRVPFSIDAHRSPHEQFFSNRSFLAKQVGDVRDVGAMVAYGLPLGKQNGGHRLNVQVGAFNGSGLTDQKNYWTKTLNFSAKVDYHLPLGLTLEGSVQKTHPTGGVIYLYDGGVSFRRNAFMLEAEYMRKHYTNATFKDVNAVNCMALYDIPLAGARKANRLFHHMSLRARFDAMGDHSSGAFNEEGVLAVDDVARKRITGGVTFCFLKKVAAELRLNYEKYFYDEGATPKVSERDKAVVELMVHF